MTEESEGPSSAPGAGAGDAAPTQAIPRLAKAPAKKPASKAAAPKAPAPKVPESRTSDSKPSQTDKGRPRAAAKPAKSATAASGGGAAKAPAARTTDAPKAPADQKRLIQPVGGPTGRPLTAADYEHTTKGSPASTAVIPAVKDRPLDPAPSQPLATVQAGTGRRASLRLTHVEPWSVTRLAFAISVAMMIVAVVAVAIFWFVLDLVGVWDQINKSFTTVLSDDSSSFNVTDYFGIGRVIGLTLVLSAVNVVLMTALSTIGAHLYNLAAQLMGGVEVTLAEDK